MIKKLILSLCLLSINCFAVTPFQTQISQLNSMVNPVLACGQAAATSDVNFCASFRAVAQCHCVSSGLPAGICQDMNVLYSRMISIFGSVESACAYQKDTTVQNCINDWNCFKKGGRDSTGAICSSTGNPCR
jgi:hypothetical protein